MIRPALIRAWRSPRGRLACFFLASALLVAGCAHQPAPSVEDAPGFLLGLLHGFVIMFSFIGSLFTDVRIYAYPNSGGWYDLGFLLGAAMFLGGSGASSAAPASRPQP
jgi:hypothetical protein